jgi:hypothetical protein
MDAAEVNPQVLLLAFAAGSKLFDWLQVLPKAANFPFRPAVRSENVERFSQLWRVYVARLCIRSSRLQGS